MSKHSTLHFKNANTIQEKELKYPVCIINDFIGHA